MRRELSDFARLFGSENARDVMTGTRMLVQRNAMRLEKLMDDEEETGEYSANATALSSQVFNQGMTLAKILDPSLRSGPKVAVQVNSVGGSSVTSIDGSSTGEITMATAMKELLDQGVPLEDLTDKMMVNYMANRAGQQRALTGAGMGDDDDYYPGADNVVSINAHAVGAGNTVDADEELPF